MNLRDLRYIIAVAELGHFGRAAVACCVSQPTLSGQILKLEEELGVAIFERVGKRVRPTPVGEQILVHARRAVGAAGDISSTARASRDPLAGAIRLGVIPTVAPYLMPYALPAAAEHMPRAPLIIVEDLTGRLVPALLGGDLDAAIIATDPENDRLSEISLYVEPFFLVMPTCHALAARADIAIGDIDPTSLLLLTDGHCLRDQALEVCGQAAPPQGAADVRATSLETLLQLTAANYGMTLAPGLAVAGLRDDGRLLAKPIVGGHASRRIRLAYRRDMPREQAIAALGGAIRAGLAHVGGNVIGMADHP
jgi:LysR family hydrogen peroxide-inducible transcriptional activator